MLTILSLLITALLFGGMVLYAFGFGASEKSGCDLLRRRFQERVTLFQNQSVDGCCGVIVVG